MRFRWMTYPALFWCLLAAGGSLQGQENAAASSDTTLVQGEKRKSGLEGPVKYEAQKIDNYIRSGRRS